VIAADIGDFGLLAPPGVHNWGEIGTPKWIIQLAARTADICARRAV